MTPYQEKYPGTWAMKWHDDKLSDLQRWFDNWKLEKYAFFNSETEWLTIEEHSWTCRGKKITRYEGTIGADHHNYVRKVKFETGAPPPPTFFVPVKRKYEPPPPEPAWMAMRRHLEQQRWERSYNAMVWGSLSPQQRFVANVLPPVDPPPPRYRRN